MNLMCQFHMASLEVIRIMECEPEIKFTNQKMIKINKFKILKSLSKLRYLLKLYTQGISPDTTITELILELMAIQCNHNKLTYTTIIY